MGCHLNGLSDGSPSAEATSLARESYLSLGSLDSLRSKTSCVYSRTSSSRNRTSPLDRRCKNGSSQGGRLCWREEGTEGEDGRKKRRKVAEDVYRSTVNRPHVPSDLAEGHLTDCRQSSVVKHLLHSLPRPFDPYTLKMDPM